MDLQVSLARMAEVARKVQKVLWDRKESRALTARLERQEHQVNKGGKVRQALLGCLELMDSQAQKVQRDLLERLALTVHKASRVKMVLWVSRESRAQMETRAYVASQVWMASRGKQEVMDQRDRRVHKGHRDKQVYRDKTDQRGRVAQRGGKDLKATLLLQRSERFKIKSSILKHPSKRNSLSSFRSSLDTSSPSVQRQTAAGGHTTA